MAKLPSIVYKRVDTWNEYVNNPLSGFIFDNTVGRPSEYVAQSVGIETKDNAARAGSFAGGMLAGKSGVAIGIRLGGLVGGGLAVAVAPASVPLALSDKKWACGRSGRICTFCSPGRQRFAIF